MPIRRIFLYGLSQGKILGYKEEMVNMLKNFTDKSFQQENQLSSAEVDIICTLTGVCDVCVFVICAMSVYLLFTHLIMCHCE